MKKTITALTAAAMIAARLPPLQPTPARNVATAGGPGPIIGGIIAGSIITGAILASRPARLCGLRRLRPADLRPGLLLGIAAGLRSLGAM